MKVTRTSGLVAVLALAIAAPAGAGASPDDRPGPQGIGSGTVSISPDDRPGARGSSPTTDLATVAPDDRAGVRGIGRSALNLSPDDRLGPRGDTVAQTRPPATIIVRPGGFDWADAGIGAAVAIGAALLGAGMLLAGRRRSVAHPA